MGRHDLPIISSCYEILQRMFIVGMQSVPQQRMEVNGKTLTVAFS
jgi:hypothetical protein